MAISKNLLFRDVAAATDRSECIFFFIAIASVLGAFSERSWQFLRMCFSNMLLLQQTQI